MDASRDLEKISANLLFNGIAEEDIVSMLKCLDYRIAVFEKGDFIFLEEDHIRSVGIVLEGTVDMIKEDIWGNGAILVRMHEGELFGETFTCGRDNRSVVSFRATSEARVMFIPFDRIMHTCSMTCVFHHRLIENMVEAIADKNRELMLKLDVISKRSLREKIMAYLSQQAQTQGNMSFKIPLSRTELAEFLCADRSALTRELSNMKKEGMIDYEKNIFRMK